jgi:hypothetical protein
MTTIVAYKGFDADWTCRGFKYEIGKTYTTDKAKLCNTGFHACEIPLDVWSYYSGKFAQVELGDMSEEKESDSKRVGKSITIKVALEIPMLIKAQVEWVLKHAKKDTATGNYRHAAATGNYGHAAATGYSGHAAATGDSGHAAATGYSGHAAATGNYGHAAATGDSGHAAATGYSGHAAATGYSGHAAVTGNSGHAAATGNYGCSFAGFNGKAKASAMGSFAIAWFDKKADRALLIVGNPGIDGIKADTWYEVSNGKLVETK